MQTRDPRTFKVPPFWISGWPEVNAYLAGVQKAQRWEIGKSQGGRPIAAIAYGDREPIDRKGNLFSAQLHGHLEDFFDPEKRSRPVMLVVGSIHGSETEGSVTCVNFAHLMETGTDLRGRRWDALCELGGQMRVVLVPIAQPDGYIRSAVRGLPGEGGDLVCGTPRLAPGESAPPEYWHRRNPMPPESVEVMGTYFNDAGVDLNTGDFFAVNMAPGTRVLLDLACAETPDCLIVLHSHNPGPWITGPRAHVPQRCQFHQAQLGALVAERHRREGLRPAWQAATRGDAMDCFDLPTAMHHVCGALPLSFEFPHFLMPTFTVDEILDIGLTMLEEVLRYVMTWRYRPASPTYNRDQGLRAVPVRQNIK